MKPVLSKFLFFFLVNGIAAYAFSQSKVKLDIQLNTPDLIGEKCMNNDSFFNWLKDLNNVFREELEKEKGNREAVLLVRLSDDAKPEFSLSFGPYLEEENRLRILNRINNQPDFRTWFTEYSLMVKATLNEGMQKKTSFYPPVIFPFEQRLTAFSQMTLAEKAVNLKAWVDEEIIPVLVRFQKEVDKQFIGVRGLGQILENKQFANTYTSQFIDTSYHYWRAVIEMAKGNQLIPFSRICMHLSNSEWDIAANYLKVMEPFSDKNSLVKYLSGEIGDKLNMLMEHLNAEIKEGIKLHDAGQYVQALKQYESIYKVCPSSAFLNYERYLSTVALALRNKTAETREIWLRFRPTIYQANPLYTSMANANNGREGFELVCRRMVAGLFKEKGKTQQDMLAYADLALELGDYAFAAHLYWWLASTLGNDAYEGRVLTHDFLYALHQLGDTKLVNNFEGDFKKVFEAIDRRRQMMMESDSMYQSFENK